MNNRVGVIGDKESIMAFRSVGLEVFDATTGDQADKLIKQLTEQQFAVIFITEKLAMQIQDTLTKSKTRAYPAIVPIPTAEGNSGFGMMGIKKDVEKAIGTDILFKED